MIISYDTLVPVRAGLLTPYPGNPGGGPAATNVVPLREVVYLGGSSQASVSEGGQIDDPEN